jgi:hypothetical protein
MRAGEAGFGLVESLLAACLLLVGLLLSLAAFDAGRRSLARSETLADEQQASRTAFAEVVARVRAAGLDVDPGIEPARPDEAIEAAYGGAVVVRGDFDGADPAEAGSPETALAGGAFETVTTGNDEIVVYALARGDGTDTGSLTFSADVAEARRDGAVEAVTVASIALDALRPPYTLYRITLSNDPTKWGSGSFLVRQPLLDGVTSLSFRYHDASGSELPAGSMEGSESDEARLLRSRIRRVSIVCTGASLRLAAEVAPPNLGRSGAGDAR